jgi:putative transposase
VIIKPETVIRWHREGFKFFWTRSAQGKQAGRQSVTAQVKALLKQVAQANLLWGVPRIYGNLFQLGIDFENKPLFQQSSASLRRKGAYSNYR